MECVNKICSEILGAKYPDVLENNLQGIYRGYNEAINVIFLIIRLPQIQKNGNLRDMKTCLQGSKFKYGKHHN